MKVFIDTNIFLDLILKREYHKEALQIFNSISSNIHSGVILDITILNIDYIAKKQTKNIKEFLKAINDNFEIYGADNNLISKALQINNKDLEDNLQYLCAKESKCELIITNDNSFYSEKIKVFSSFEFIKSI